MKFIKLHSPKLPVFKFGESADLRQLFGWDPGISWLRCLIMFEDLSLSFETHFESLDFESGSSSYDHFSEGCINRIFGQDYYGKLRVLGFNF